VLDLDAAQPHVRELLRQRSLLRRHDLHWVDASQLRRVGRSLRRVPQVLGLRARHQRPRQSLCGPGRTQLDFEQLF
jgi:hypothetical protein